MERQAIEQRLGSYNIDKKLVESLTTFFDQTLAASLSADLTDYKQEGTTVITVIYSGDSIQFGNLHDFSVYPFRHPIEAICISLSQLIRTPDHHDKAFVLELSFGKDVADNYFRLALQDDNAKARLDAITRQLLAQLESHRNHHSRYYRNEVVHAAFFVAGAVFGTLAFAIQDVTFGLVLGALAIIGLVLFVVITINNIRGYSSFKLAS
jgi:hypothetical protein